MRLPFCKPLDMLPRRHTRAPRRRDPSRLLASGVADQLSLPTLSGAGRETLVYGPAPDRRRVFNAIIHEPRQPGTVTELSRVAHCPQ